MACETCKGQRVVLVPDEDACKVDPEAAQTLQAYHAHRREEAAYRAECAAERRMGA